MPSLAVNRNFPKFKLTTFIDLGYRAGVVVFNITAPRREMYLLGSTPESSKALQGTLKPNILHKEIAEATCHDTCAAITHY